MNGLNYWTGSAAVVGPADKKIGARIGVGAQAGTCNSAAGTGGAGFVCYDYSSSSTGLAVVQGVGTGGTVDIPKPRVWATTSCTGSPFFSDAFVVAPATTCAASVQAVLQTGSGTVGAASKKTFDATLTGLGTKPMTFDSAAGYWTTGYVFAVPPQDGPHDVTLVWQSTTGGKRTYSNIQRVYSGSDDCRGPQGPVAYERDDDARRAVHAVGGHPHDHRPRRPRWQPRPDEHRADHDAPAHRRQPVERYRVRRARGCGVQERDRQRLSDAVPAQFGRRLPRPGAAVGAGGLCPDQDRDDGRPDAAGPRRTLLRVPGEQLARVRRRQRPEGGQAPDHGLLLAGRQRRHGRARLRTSRPSTSRAGRTRSAATTLRPPQTSRRARSGATSSSTPSPTPTPGD